MMWSDNPTEEQLMAVFSSPYCFKIMRMLMKKPMAVKPMAHEFGITNYERVYAAIRKLKKAGLIKILSYEQTNDYSKSAVFTPTIKNLTVTIAKETTISTDTKLILHNEDYKL